MIALTVPALCRRCAALGVHGDPRRYGFKADDVLGLLPGGCSQAGMLACCRRSRWREEDW